MKRYIVLFGLFIFFGFVVGNKTSAQPGCQYCFAPWVCSQFSLNINCNGVDYTITYTICYFCHVTNPDVDVVITEIAAIPIGTECYWQAKQAGEQWILEHGMDFCGTLPCREGRRRFKIYEPICADMILLNENKYTIRLNPNCNLKCYREYEWCWCSCVPGECLDDGCPNPHVILQEVIGPTGEGSGSCKFQELPPNWPPNFVIPCQRFDTYCNEDGYPQ